MQRFARCDNRWFLFLDFLFGRRQRDLDRQHNNPRKGLRPLDLL
jgi:hypothetical protein